MKKLYGFIAALTLVASVIAAPITAAASSSGYINQADIDVLDTASKAFEEFAAETNSSSATIESVEAKAATATTALGKVEGHTFSSDLGTQYTAEAATLKTEASNLKTEVAKVTGVLNTGDETQINEYFDGLNAAATRFDNQIGKLNAAVDESNNTKGTGYLWLVIITAILAAGMFVWAFLLDKKAVPQLTKARRAVAYTSLAPLAGAAITYVTFIFADQLGGSYFIAYGPVLFGAVILVQALINYLKLAKATVA